MLAAYMIAPFIDYDTQMVFWLAFGMSPSRLGAGSFFGAASKDSRRSAVQSGEDAVAKCSRGVQTYVGR